MSLASITTLVSGAYTLYCIHPYVPYSFLWRAIAVPTLNYISNTSRKRICEQEKIEKELEFYEIIKESRDPSTGVITRYLILKRDCESDYTIINYEYDRNEPVWL